MECCLHTKETRYRAIVAGVSFGGMDALEQILPALPENFRLPLIIVQHIGPESDDYRVEHLNSMCRITVKLAEEKESIQPAHAYLAPPGYHLLIEDTLTFSFSLEERVHFARPAIDVLFDTAVYTYGSRLIGLILTGANSDGSEGLRMIKDAGGLIIVQDPKTAMAPAMPEAAIAAANPDYIIPLGQIGPFLATIENNCPTKTRRRNAQ